MLLARDLRAAQTIVFASFLLLFPALVCLGDIVGFEDNSLYSQGSNGLYYNGDLGSNTTNSQGWKSGNLGFSNSYTFDSQFNFGYWSGFSYSRVNAGNVSGFQNQYASKPGTGSEGSTHYAIAYNSFVGDSIITFGAQVQIASIDISNTAYAYFSMKDGDQFSKKFGGASGNDLDFFKLQILGFRGSTQTAAIDFFLADYRFENNNQDYVVDQWTRVDLANLGVIDSLKFSLSSSDNGQFGMNTPAYFAMDRIEYSAVPEPGSLSLLGIAALGWWVRKRTRRR
ncbi:MAG: DUF4465 domain-containing protein [Planctomycetota bacterium]